jgi:hypothetical protein
LSRILIAKFLSSHPLLLSIVPHDNPIAGMI